MLFSRGGSPGERCKSPPLSIAIGHTDLGVHLRQPISWSWGQAKPTQNEYSWTNLLSILYVEQPVGTSFSQGVPNIKVRLRTSVLHGLDRGC